MHVEFLTSYKEKEYLGHPIRTIKSTSCISRPILSATVATRHRIVLSLLENSLKIRDFDSCVYLWNILIHRYAVDMTLLFYAASPNKCVIEIKTCETVTLDLDNLPLARM